jgi:hypothetical protein
MVLALERQQVLRTPFQPHSKMHSKATRMIATTLPMKMRSL